MAYTSLTKETIVHTVKQLMEERTLDKIQVREITARCGINRNTFYYYFQDKYEILETILNEEIIPLLEPYFNRKDWVQSLVVLTERMKKEPRFFAHAMKMEGNGSMGELLTKVYREFLLQETEAISETFDYQKREMMVRFYSHGIIGMLTDWVRFGMKQDVSEAIRTIAYAVNQNVFSSKQKKREGEEWQEKARINGRKDSSVKNG